MTKKKVTFRHEVKYFISHYQYHCLKQRIKLLMRPDQHADKDGNYHLRSLYFDDMYNSALFEKLSGVLDRYKYRIRIYNHSDAVIKLEKKGKHNQFIFKQAQSIDRKQYESLLVNSNHSNKKLSDKKELLNEFLIIQKTQLLKPVIITDYVREAYVFKQGNVRVTFDKNLKLSYSNEDLFDKKSFTISACDQHLVIMEVKYEKFLPAFIKQALDGSHCARSAISKYAICRKFYKENPWEDQ
ncbi:MAG: polyphosphate polymerase domain-containing protein [bacterium]